MAKLKTDLVVADGNKYCNMMGHNNNRMDYVWTWSYGKMELYPNLGKESVASNEFYWGEKVEIWNAQNALGKLVDRRDLHLADWNNDGACDIIWTDPANNNRVSVWLNKYKATGTWTWDYLANPAPQVTCPEKKGVGIHDIPVRFGDLTGNGLSDYICIEPDGRSYGYIHNTDGSWTFVNQYKFSVGADRLVGLDFRRVPVSPC